MRAATDPEAEAGSYWGPRWFFELNGQPVKARIRPRAKDREMAAKLFDISEQLTGVSFPGRAA